VNSYEAVKVLLEGPAAVEGLVLQLPKRCELALALDDQLDARGAEASNQLVLEVGVAHVEAETLQLRAVEIRSEAGVLETSADVILLREVVQTCESDVTSVWSEQGQETPDVRCAAHRDDGDRLIAKIPLASRGDDLESDLIAQSFDEYDG
jgi:hypothetical protein